MTFLKSRQRKSSIAIAFSAAFLFRPKFTRTACRLAGSCWMRLSRRVLKVCWPRCQKLNSALIGEQGLILLDPLDPQLKQAAAPLYAEAARSAHEIALAIVNRSRELEQAGYHAQVAPSENSFPLFWHDDNGARHALTRNEKGKYQAKSAGQKPDREGGPAAAQEFSAEELAAWALREPDAR